MREQKHLLAAAFFLLLPVYGNSQIAESWTFQGFSIGQDAPVSGFADECFMPEIVAVGSEYYMYYTGRYSGKSAIWYATSPDMINWTVQDTIMVGSADGSNREFEIGGPSVIKTSGGQYRMFYRCCEQYTVGPPPYHIRSAVSSDGINFVKEGIRIEIQPYLADSYFTLAGQSAFYTDPGGNVRAVITGSDTTMGTSTPSRLYTSQSSDEGMTWTTFTPVYDNAHDPVVICDSSGNYHLYCSYLLDGHRKTESADGVGWPVSLDTIQLKAGAVTLTEESTPDMVADLGAGVTATGQIVLYSNHKPYTPGPWTNIAYYYESMADAQPGAEKEIIRLYPNPVSEHIFIASFNTSSDTITIYDAAGNILFSGLVPEGAKIDCQGWDSGIYFYRLTREGIQTGSGKIVKN